MIPHKTPQLHQTDFTPTVIVAPNQTSKKVAPEILLLNTIKGVFIDGRMVVGADLLIIETTQVMNKIQPGR